MRRSALTLAGVTLAVLLVASAPWSRGDGASAPPPPIDWNDNRETAGTLQDGVLELELVVRRGVWHPLGPDEPGAEVLAFGAAGERLQIPGPLVRVPLGTRVRVRVRNPLDTTLVVHGLSARRVPVMEGLVIPAGAMGVVRFTADAPGTYFYRGQVTGSPSASRSFEDALLAGALIVDPPAAPSPPDDRVLLIQIWFDGQTEAGKPDFSREFLVINGRPWPHTERLTYDMRDSIRWRLINASGGTHPMHLHGFFYRVDARGDMARDTIYWPAQRRMAVTERLAPGTTMRMAWSPDRPGGWIFHCHNSFHVLANPTLDPEPPGSAERFIPMLLGESHGDPNRHVVNGMGGLLMAIYVRPPEGWEPREPRRTRFRLFVQSDSVATDSIGSPFTLAAPWRRRFAYVLQEGPREPAPDSVQLPGPPIIIHVGEPTGVMVINRTPEPTQVHWHGLEIESYYDGVAGVGGYPNRLTPAILPGDSFEMRITPRRAGTYMYHTHVNDIRQQSAGLYGAFIVLERDQEWDPEHDRILLLGLAPHAEGVFLNGSAEPEPMPLRTGHTYRLRLMNITLGHGNARVRLLRDGAPVRWRLVAKDAWDLPDHQRVEVPAEQIVSVGETFDFEYAPTSPGELVLEVRSAEDELLLEQLVRVSQDPT